MASSTVRKYFICHFCFDEFPNRSSLVSHFSQCHMKNATKRNDATNSLPRLNKNDRDILQMLKLHRSNNNRSSSSKTKYRTNPYLQIPLSISSTYSLKQTSFDDSICNNTTNSLLNVNNQFEEKIVPNTLNSKSSSYFHTYKYSRREQKIFYASVKKARLKKPYAHSKKSHVNSIKFNKEKFFINLPTKINLRQRLNTNSNNSFPLIFDPNFNSLVQLSKNNLFRNYFSDIKIYFHLLHSIASQEFQIIINSNDNQHHVSYTAFSFINVLRQTMTDYTINLQKNFKRNYFQSFQHDEQQITTPFKMPRLDQNTSSNIHISTNCQCFETPSDNTLPSTPIMNTSVIEPVQPELNSIPRQPPKNRTNTQPIQASFIPIVEQQNISRSPSPILLKKQKLEPVQNDQSPIPVEKARIRIINGPSENRKQPSFSKLNNSPDENSLVKPTRMTTRKSPIKTENITETNPSFETKPVILTPNEISKEWSKHNVFYRCHACSHEEFFGVLSRECISLHISSKHGNMEENFKQRLSNFLNNKGRSLKIFQHYLKWQQPWPEKEVEKMFKYSNK